MPRRMKGRTIILWVILIALSHQVWSQTATLKGRIIDDQKDAIEYVNISLMGFPGGTTSDQYGRFSIEIPAGRQVTLAFSHVSYEKYIRKFKVAEGETERVEIMMNSSATMLDTFIVSAAAGDKGSGLLRVDPKTATVNPGPGEGLAAVLRTQPGVMSNNELSSQYNVRGGNFDENLVYVNGIQIYRPLLIRSGQQEGLSFVNTDLVSGIVFSAGGFEAKYGDKMSSVLDVTYKKPQEFAASFTGSLMGVAAHVEGQTLGRRVSYLLGVRQKSNQYLLGSLETKGDYKPSFTDVQSYLVWDLNARWEFSFLGNYSRNLYRFVPETRQTDYGTINEALRLTVYFDGSEADRFEHMTGAFTTTYKPSDQLHLRFIVSAFRTVESETFDILGQYWLDQLEADLGDESFGDIAFNRGVGAFLDHARNRLEARVVSMQHRAWYQHNHGLMQWGINAQNEFITDQINEWQVIDSAGYSLPHPINYVGYNAPGFVNGQSLDLFYVLKASNELVSQRYNAFVQNSWTFDSSGVKLTAGLRSSYWSLNEEITLSPRASLAWTPQTLDHWTFRLAAGYYHQPPFYRELRDLEGEIHPENLAQRSIHVVAGAEHDFEVWDRPFLFFVETYYKHLDNLIPYEIDNVRIRYLADERSEGYAAGIDMKVNGEFVAGVDSWMSLSIMKTMEDIIGDYYYDYFNEAGEKIIPGYTFDQVAVDSIRYEPGYIPRPADQRFNFSLFFQDFLPRNPSYKMHLNLVYGSRLPFGPPSSPKYLDTLRMPPYRRVDIGFSKQIKESGQYLKPGNPFRHFETVWLSLEVFNLLAINNTISHIWITDVTNRNYAVPNYLTPRRINLKLVCAF